MRILANVTSSLLDDYNAILEKIGAHLNGETYFSVELAGSETLSDEYLDEFDMFINFFDDDDDILPIYENIAHYAELHGRFNAVISYYRYNESYSHESVYYTKASVNRERRHRFVMYDNINDVIFDLFVYASLYFGANITIKRGMLCFKDYSIVDMGLVSYLGQNERLNSYYRDICNAHDDEMANASTGVIDDRRNLRDIEEIHHYLDKAYATYDSYLYNYISLYSEVIDAFNNEYISKLDYIYVKEYFRIGHLTSIVSCFNRRGYISDFEQGRLPFKESMNILKLIVYSMTFADNNEFVDEILENVMKVGQNIEKQNKKDCFFYCYAHDYALKIDGNDDYSLIEKYILMLKNGELEADVRNVYYAYRTLAMHYRHMGMIDDAISMAERAFSNAIRNIDMIKDAMLLYELYSVNAEYDKVNEYMHIIMDNIDLMDNGYHNGYLSIALDLIDGNEDNELLDAWIDDVIDRAFRCKYIDKNLRYAVYVKGLERKSLNIDTNKRIIMLENLIKEMVEDFYICPVDMYVNIYNAFITLAGCYEKIGMRDKASDAYKRAYIYVTTIEEVGEIDERANYIQYRIADIDIDNESSKSYRLLVKAEKRAREYILRTHNYLEYYRKILTSIEDRIISDGKKRLGKVVAKQYLARLVRCNSVNERYIVDLYEYCQYMAGLFARNEMYDEQDIYENLARNYSATCKKNNIEID